MRVFLSNFTYLFQVSSFRRIASRPKFLIKVFTFYRWQGSIHLEISSECILRVSCGYLAGIKLVLTVTHRFFDVFLKMISLSLQTIKIQFFLMTSSNLTSEVLMNLLGKNESLISMG